MIDKILDKLGLVRKNKVDGFRDLSSNPFTEDELSYLLVEIMGDVDVDANEEAEDKIFKEARNVEGLIAYLQTAAMRDMRRYFGAQTPQEQMIIRGSFARTNYLKARISGAEDRKKTKIDGLRYS